MYWRAKENIEGRYSSDLIPAGAVLLLTRIDQFDGQMHTVFIDGHPLLHPGSTFSFLVDDFLGKFEFEPDAEAVRTRELASLQAEVNRLQGELMEGQSSPLLMASYVEDAVARWETQKGIDTTAGLPALVNQQQSMNTSISSAISRRVTTDDVKAMQVFAERHSVVAKAQAEWIEERTTRIASTFKAMSPFFKEKASVALAKTQHIRDYVKKVMSGLESMDLYIGNGVEVETLATGESASPDEKLALFQRKLFINEELAVWADVGENFDFQSLKVFDECIAANPSLRDQLLPSPRSVVSIAIRRSDVNYKEMSAREASDRNKQNKAVFLLVRDGENVHRVYSAQPTHENTPRLFPTKDELDNLFKGIDGAEITFNDLEFTKTAKKSESVSLHYKRFLILLCGLDHRLNLFGRFYDPAEYGKFISLGFQAEHFQFVTDDEPNFMLGEGKKPVLAWLKEQNSFMQSGSRVMCYHPDLICPDTAPGCQRMERDGRYDHVRTLAKPLSDSELLIAYRDGKEICVEVRAKRDTWRDVVNEHINARVSLSKADYRSYLCLDAVKADEVDYYIYNREARIQHVYFIRLFKEAALILKNDADSESESRAYIRGCVSEAGFADDGSLDGLIDAAVRTWRAANRGKPLLSVDSKEGLHPILDQIYALCKTTESILRVEKFVSEQGLIPLKLVMTGRNKLILYVEAPVEQRDTRLMEWKWVKRLTLNVLKTKLSVGGETLVWLTDKPNAGETELKVYDGLSGWINTLPEPYKADKLIEHCDVMNKPMSLIRDASGFTPDDLFLRLMIGFEGVLKASKKRVKDAYIGVPIATYLNKDQQIRTVVVCLHAANWLWSFGNESQRQELSRFFVAKYMNKAHARSVMMAPVDYDIRAIDSLMSNSIALIDADDLYRTGPPPGTSNAVRLKIGEEVATYGSGVTSTRTIERKRSLNRFMQALMRDEKFIEFSAQHRVTFNPAAWDGTRSHLEKHLSRGLPLPKTRKNG